LNIDYFFQDTDTCVNLITYNDCCIFIAVFSSLATTKLPIVERQAFIFPASIEHMQETITEKGITSKHIIGM